MSYNRRMILVLLLLLVLVILLFWGLRYRAVDLGLKQLLFNIRHGATEFPVTAGIALGAWFLSLALIFEWLQGEPYLRLLAISAVLVPLSYALTVLGRAARFSRLIAALLAFLGCGGLGAWAQGFHANSFFYLMVLYAIAAFVLICACQSPGTEDNSSFLEENQKTGSFLIMGAVTGLILGLGLGAILLSVRYLFDVNIPASSYGVLAAVCGFLVAPFVFLGLAAAPASSAKKSPLLFISVSILKDYLLIPLVLVYTLILYAYTVRILFAGELPKGMVGWMVSWYAGGGLLLWVACYPEQARIASSAKFFFRRYLLLLPPLLPLLAAAVWERVGQYGFTEDRYFLLLFTVWLAVSAIYFLLRPAAPLRALPLSAFILLMLASFGPWSAFSVSRHSQLVRWAYHLAQLGMPSAPGREKTVKPDIKAEAELSRVCDYISRMHGMAALKGHVPVGIPDSCSALFVQLGVTYVESYLRQGTGHYTAYSASRRAYDIAGYDYLFSNVSAGLNESAGAGFRVTIDQSQLKVLQNEGIIAEIPFAESVIARMQELRAEGQPLHSLPPERLTFEFQTPRVKAKFLFHSITVVVEAGVPKPGYYTADLLLRIE